MIGWLTSESDRVTDPKYVLAHPRMNARSLNPREITVWSIWSFTSRFGYRFTIYLDVASSLYRLCHASTLDCCGSRKQNDIQVSCNNPGCDEYTITIQTDTHIVTQFGLWFMHTCKTIINLCTRQTSSTVRCLYATRM